MLCNLKHRAPPCLPKALLSKLYSQPLQFLQFFNMLCIMFSNQYTSAKHHFSLLLALDTQSSFEKLSNQIATGNRTALQFSRPSSVTKCESTRHQTAPEKRQSVCMWNTGRNTSVVVSDIVISLHALIKLWCGFRFPASTRKNKNSYSLH